MLNRLSQAASPAMCQARVKLDGRVAFWAVDEHSQADGFVRETDGFTYAINEDGDLLWFISPVVYYRRRRREEEAVDPPAEPDS